MSGYNSDDLDRLEPSYLSSYGLQEAPFAANHHDKFLFLDAERAQRLNMLQHMVRYSNLLLIVQGEQGVGKTSLMHRFIHNAEPNWQLCEVTANTMIDADQLLFQAAQGFGVRELPQDASELQELLYAQIATFHHNEQTPILIIDDAHLLPKDALLAIFNLADAYVNDVNLLRIILFAEPQIDKILNSKDVKVLSERVTHSMEISALDEEGTAEYLKHRLAVAGFNGGSPFTPKMVKKIYRSSAGIPAKINEFAHEALEVGDISQPDMIELDDDQLSVTGSVSETQQRKQARPVVYATIATLVVVVLLVFQDSINKLFEDGSVTESTEQQSQATVPQNKNEATQEQLSREIDLKEKIIPLAEQPEVVSETTENKSEVSDTEQPAESKVTATKVVEPVESAEQKPVPTIVSIEPSKITISNKQQTIKIIGEGFSENSEIIIGWTGKQKKLAQSQMRVVNDNEIEIAITVGMNEDDWTLQVVEPEKNGSKKIESNQFAFKVVDTLVDEGYRKDRWLLAQEPGNFTLQLFSSNKKASADNFIEQHNIKDKAGVFYTQRKGADWYSVVYGNYSSQAIARQAVQQLPVSLKKIKPWVRRMDDIQASINASRQLAQKKKSRKVTPSKTVLTKPTAVSSAAPKKLPSTNAPSQHESWLWSQDPRNFTLQLLGARQSTSIEKFIKKYKSLNGKTVYFHTRHDQRDWYTVVYGVYPDRESASKAIKRLPAELQGSSPWIRSFGSIHAELDRAE